MADPRWIASAASSWATAANWDQLTVPVNSDNVYLRNSSIDINDGFNQSAVTLTSLRHEMSFTGKVGLAQQTAKAVVSITRASSTATATVTAHGFATGQAITISGAVETEYNGTFTITSTGADTFTYAVTGTPSTPATGTIRAKVADYLKIGVTTAYFGEPSKSSSAGTGSGRLRFDFGSVQNTTYVIGTATTSTDTGEEPLRLLGSHASNKLYVSGGRVGFAMAAGQTGTLSLLAVTGQAAVVNVGSGTSLTTARLEKGTTTLFCAATTVTQEGGTFNTEGSGAIATIFAAGTANLNSTGTITTLEVNPGGHANFLASKAARMVTTVKMYKGATLSYDPAVVTITNPIQLIGCKLEEVTINTPAGVTVAIVKT